MGGVRTSEAVGISRVKFAAQCRDIVRGQYAVRVDEDKVVSAGSEYAVITGYGAPLVVFIMVLQVYDTLVTPTDIAAGLGRASSTIIASIPGRFARQGF